MRVETDQMSPWRADLHAAARQASFPFPSMDLIVNEAHGRAAAACLRAFGSDSASRLYAEPRTPHRPSSENAKPSDLLLLHPDLGAVFFEVKGWNLHSILGIEAGLITLETADGVIYKDPWQQAGDAMLQVRDATRRVIKNRRIAAYQIPYFERFVMFPNISRKGWRDRGFDKAISASEILFREDMEHPETLRARLLDLLKCKRSWRPPFGEERLDHVREALGSSVVLDKNQRGNCAEDRGLGGIVDSAVQRTRRLSAEQQDLIEAEFDGCPHLVRGVAGSGKTTVLVKNFVRMLDRKLNSAQLNLYDAPEQRYAVICFNQSLVPLLHRTVQDAFRELTREELPSCVHIHHLNGLLYELSSKRGGPLAYQSYKRYQDRPGSPKSAQIAASCCAQLDELAAARPAEFAALQYDAVYVDEEQDLTPEEYVLLHKLLRADRRTKEKNLVIFYDDAQNLYGRPRPVWSELGIAISPARSSVMKVCHRNPRQIVEFAFNMLLGAAAETRAMTRTFAATNYLKSNQLIEELPNRWLVHFASRNDGTVPEVKLFETRQDEMRWGASKLDELINREKVRPEDILIVFDQAFTAEEECKELQRELERQVCARCLAVKRLVRPYGRPDNPDKKICIFQEHCLTLATVGAAKGYDSPIVLMLGADLYPTTTEGRASFYVAATRATVRLFIAGLRRPGTPAVEAELTAAFLADSTPQVEIVSVPDRKYAVSVSPAAAHMPEPADLQPAGAEIPASAAKPAGFGWKQLLSRAFRR